MLDDTGLLARPADFTMAFQPIVDLVKGNVFAYEALVRGPDGQGADSVFAQVPQRDSLAFDAACRARALEMAAAFGLTCKLSVNISTAAMCDYRFGIRDTLRVARRVGFPANKLIFEITEHAPIADMSEFRHWTAACRRRGITVAIDDFGAGYSTINSLFQQCPAMVKLDMGLVRNIDIDRSRQALVKGVVAACDALGSRIVAEGVETVHEWRTLSELGIGLMQGYFFAKPGLACLPAVHPPSLTAQARHRLPWGAPHPSIP